MINASVQLHVFVVSAVGMPVTRHPPHSPGRAVFPHPVPRSYSLPRKCALSGGCSSSAYFRNAWPFNFHTVEQVIETSIGKTAAFASPSVEPLEDSLQADLKRHNRRHNSKGTTAKAQQCQVYTLTLINFVCSFSTRFLSSASSAIFAANLLLACDTADSPIPNRSPISFSRAPLYLWLM